MFWKTVKKAFAWGFGGRLGWMLGGFVGGIAARFVRLLWLWAAGFALAIGAQYLPDTSKGITPAQKAAHAKYDAQQAAKVKVEKKVEEVKNPFK